MEGENENMENNENAEEIKVEEPGKIIDIRLDEFVDYEHRKKLKKRDFSTLGKKRKITKRSENDQTVVNMIKDKKERTLRMTLDEFKQKYGSMINIEDPSEEIYQYYFQLFKTSSLTKAISFARQLCPGEMTYHCINTIETEFVTSDLLYWTSNIKDYEVANIFEDREYSIKEIYCCSIKPIFIRNVLDDVKEYYIQDYNQNFSSPDWPEDLKYSQSIYVEPQIEYWYNMKEYVACDVIERPQIGEPYKRCNFYSTFIRTNNNVDKKKLQENLVEFATNHRYIKYDKKMLINGIKKFKINKGTYYFQRRFVPTDFCPTTLTGLEKFDMKVMFTVKFPMSSYFDICVKSNKIVVLNFVTFENIDYFYDFLQVVKVTTELLNENNEDLLQFIEVYAENRESFKEFNVVYSELEKNLVFFYDSFSKRINVDRIRTIYDKIRETISKWNHIPNSLITKYNLCVSYIKKYAKQMVHFFNLNVEDMLNTINYCCLLCLSPRDDSKNIEKAARYCGYMIFNLFKGGKEDVFNVIRSQCSFLENIIGNATSEDVEAYIHDLRKARKKDEINKEEKLSIEEEARKQNLVHQIRKLDVNINLKGYNTDELENILNELIEESIEKNNEEKLAKIKENKKKLKQQIELTEDLKKQIIDINTQNFYDSLLAGNNEAFNILATVYNSFSVGEKSKVLEDAGIKLSQKDLLNVTQGWTLYDVYRFLEQSPQFQQNLAKVKVDVATAINQVNMEKAQRLEEREKKLKDELKELKKQ